MIVSDEVISRAKNIKMVVFDVDGVLTDGSLFFGDDGQEYKAFNSLDGHGMKMLQQSGVEIAIITGRTSNVVKYRAENLGIGLVYQGKADKLPAFEELLKKQNLTAEQVAYVGDDVVDLPILIRSGFAITVKNGHELAKQHAHWITPNLGGHGAARDICELIMKAQGKYDSMMQEYLK